MATEASNCAIRYGFEVLDFGKIEASTDVANAASVRVLQKLGMSFRRRAVLDGLDTVFYTLLRNEWWKASQLPAVANHGVSQRPDSKIGERRSHLSGGTLVCTD
jgi:Acetyltransferase (GNAT) domain